MQEVVTHDAAAVLYDAGLPGGTLRFAEFSRFDSGQIASITPLYVASARLRSVEDAAKAHQIAAADGVPGKIVLTT